MQPQNVDEYAKAIRQELPDSVKSGNEEGNHDHVYYLNERVIDIIPN
ncbi:hypothetical protein ACO2FA_13435 [Staphylococcus warneri]